MSTARVVIKGEDQLKNPLKQAENELTGFQSVAEKVGQTLKTAFALGAIIKGVQELSKAVADCVNNFKAQIEVDTRLEAVLKATDQQYKYTTRDIKEYASALQQQTRFADDAIESAAQLLVATKKFSKEGLERTLDLSADLAEAMGTDITSAAQTLSKALQEPGEGLARLKTIGVTFTDTEENMIKSLRDAGDELSAQQVILDRVEQAYGGVAKSIGSIDTSTLDKIGKVWSDIKEDLGNIFTNTLGPVFDWIYEKLIWLQRLTNQVAEKSNLKKYMREGNVDAIADNFTTDFLTEQLNKTYKDYRKAMELLTTDYADAFLQIEEKFHINVEEFVEKGWDEQWDILKEVFGEDSQLPFNITQIADNTYETVMLTKALERQQELDAEAERKFQYEQENNTAKQTAAIVNAVGGISTVFDNAKLGLFKDATVEGLTGNVLSSYLQSYFGSGLSNSATMSILYGNLGMWTQTTQAFMSTMYDWGDDLDELIKNLSLSPLFTSPTLSTLGIGGMKNINFKDQIGLNELQTIVDTYGKNSQSFQQDLLQQQIDYLSDALESAFELVGEDSPIVTYLTEIYGTLNDQLAQLKKQNKGDGSGSGSNKGSLGKLFSGMGEAMGNLENAAETVFEDFKSQAGEAGDLINRLATNMATMGPALGAIVTALHYAIEGLIETLGDLINDFVQWGIQPLMEFGRMIGSILKPILEEIMPSVVASGKVLMQLFQAIARVLTPIVQILMRTLGPVLTVLADVVVSIVGTISWACDWIAYAITWVLNKISLGFIQQSANPGSLSSYLEGMYSDPSSTYTGSGSTSSTGLTSAAYSGGTTIHINIYQNAPVVGSGGMQEFCVMIKNELQDVAYFSR